MWRFLVFLLALSSAWAWHPQEVPRPDTYQVDTWVSDPNHYLSIREIQKLDRHLNKYSSLKKEHHWVACGPVMKPYQVAISVIDQMDPNWDVNTFAKEVFDSWGLGYPECHNGVLIFISQLDRELSIVRGAGVSSQVISHAFRTQVINEMKFFLRQGKLTEALDVAAVQITHELSRTAYRFRPRVHSDAYIGGDGDWHGLLVAMVVIFTFFGFFALLVSCLQHVSQPRHHPTGGYGYRSWYPWNWYASWDYYWNDPYYRSSHRSRPRPRPRGFEDPHPADRVAENPIHPRPTIHEERDERPAGGKSGDATGSSWGPPDRRTPTRDSVLPNDLVDDLTRDLPSTVRQPVVVSDPVTPRPTIHEKRDEHPAGGQSGDATGSSWGPPDRRTLPRNSILPNGISDNLIHGLGGNLIHGLSGNPTHGLTRDLPSTVRQPVVVPDPITPRPTVHEKRDEHPAGGQSGDATGASWDASPTSSPVRRRSTRRSSGSQRRSSPSSPRNQTSADATGGSW